MAELQILECPTCGGPLDLMVSDARTIRCKYCSTSIVIPEELRHAKPEGIASLLHSDTIQLREIIKLIHAGRKIEAIKLYREQTGVGLKEAKETIDRLWEGKSVQVANFMIETQPMSSSVYPSKKDAAASKGKGKTKTALLSCLLVGVVTVIVGLAIAYFAFQATGGLQKIGSALNLGGKPFAEAVVNFGGEGTGPGLSTDARTITADSAGHVYLGDRKYNRVQVFDEDGNFVTSWIAGERGYIGNMAADQDGNLYIEMAGSLNKYNGNTGELLEEIVIEDCDSIVDIKIDASGAMTIICGRFEPSILRVNSQGEVLLRVDEALSGLLDDMDDLEMVAVDGLGNIFVVSDWKNNILKFSPEGQLISRFGGDGDEPDQFEGAQDIEIDGLGRVYVSDMFGEIRIFDNDGRFIERFEGASEGMTIANNFDLFVIEDRHTVVKYVLPKALSEE